MTKFKSKKITKSTIAVIIMAIAMVAMLAFGGTYALFTAQSTAKSMNITTGRVSLKAKSTFTLSDITGVVPGDTIIPAGTVTYQNESTVQTWVAVVVSYKKGATDITPTQAAAAGITFPAPSGWTAATTAGVYVKLLDGIADANEPVDVVFNNAAITFDGDENWTEGVSDKGVNTLENVTLTISFSAQSIQARGLSEISGVTVTGGVATVATMTPEIAEAVYTQMTTAIATNTANNG